MKRTSYDGIYYAKLQATFPVTMDGTAAAFFVAAWGN
jgi:hypothetical protein